MHTRALYAIGASLLGAVVASGFLVPSFTPTRYDSATKHANVPSASSTDLSREATPDTRDVRTHVPLPKAVKAIYMTSCVVGTPSFREKLVALIERTEVNAVIIDIKDFSGTISFPPESELLKPAWDEATCGARDMQEFVAMLHKKDIYVIGRITVFQDPLRTRQRPDLAVKRASDGGVWHDHKGLAFIDVSAKDHWDYIVKLGEESYNLGFDELNFDYIRFPSDGNMQDIAFTHTGTKSKSEALEYFFAYLKTELSKQERFAAVRHENTGRASSTPYLSADLFGMTTTNTDDLSIGQILERALPYFDFVAPMVYPSHYPPTYMGFADPNKHPYQIVNHAMSEAARRARTEVTTVAGLHHTRIGTTTPPRYTKPTYDIQKLRPWLQDFDYGGNYGPAEVRAQIQATYDAGLTSWMLWAPSNIYTEGALEK